MFANTYFATRYFADRYFPGGDTGPSPTPDPFVVASSVVKYVSVNETKEDTWPRRKLKIMVAEPALTV